MATVEERTTKATSFKPFSEVAYAERLLSVCPPALRPANSGQRRSDSGQLASTFFVVWGGIGRLCASNASDWIPIGEP